MPVDDNGFMLLKTSDKKVAFLHVSCTEWKNLFSMEIYGKSGKLDLFGLGGSYGPEKITWYKMLPEMGPRNYNLGVSVADNSWAVELAVFINDIRKNLNVSANLKDALETLKIIELVYKESGLDYSS